MDLSTTLAKLSVLLLFLVPVGNGLWAQSDPTAEAQAEKIELFQQEISSARTSGEPLDSERLEQMAEEATEMLPFGYDAKYEKKLLYQQAAQFLGELGTVARPAVTKLIFLVDVGLGQSDVAFVAMQKMGVGSHLQDAYATELRLWMQTERVLRSAQEREAYGFMQDPDYRRFRLFRYARFVASWVEAVSVQLAYSMALHELPGRFPAYLTLQRLEELDMDYRETLDEDFDQLLRLIGLEDPQRRDELREELWEASFDELDGSRQPHDPHYRNALALIADIVSED